MLYYTMVLFRAGHEKKKKKEDREHAQEQLAVIFKESGKMCIVVTQTVGKAHAVFNRAYFKIL